jgi:arylsulfatase A-like enzyme
MTLSRRRFLYSSLALPAFAAKPAGEQPNIVLILADGVGAWMLGCYGNKEVHTPHIDLLATNGTRFLNHYTGAPVPGPGRDSLLAGGGTTIEKVLAGAGYNCQSANGAGAAQFIESLSTDKPFFLTASFAPYQTPVDAKYLTPYGQSKFDTWAQEPAAKNAARNQEMMGKDVLSNLRKIAAATTAFDDQVGAISAAIAQKKLADRTLVVFTSTCGSLFGAHGLWGDGEASNPINMFEEVVNTPMLWMWPGRVPPLAVRPEMVSAIDFMPTICVLSGADLPSASLPGRSYVSLGTGVPLPKKQPWKTTVFARYRNTAMARTDRYKLVWRDEGKGPGELYDDKQDPKERVNQYDNPQFMTVKASLRAAK